MVFAVRQILEKAWEFDKKLYVMFIDLQKAFDSVRRDKLWLCLEEYWINGQLLRAVKKYIYTMPE